MSISSTERAVWNLRWLKWHKKGRKGALRSPLMKEIELDITTKCSSSPGCRNVCTYRHTRDLDYTLDVGLGRRIIEQTYNLGFRQMVFSGGGEPLEPESQETFFSLLETARSQGFEISLVTNGMFLSPDILPRLFPFLDLLRISISGSSHLQAIKGNISKSVRFRNTFYPQVIVCANRLTIPNAPQEDLLEDVENLVRSEIDFVRFKRTHRGRAKKGSYATNIRAYEEASKFTSKSEKKYTKAKVLNRGRWPNSETVPYPFCYFGDFFPFNIGADGKAYACCEHKYREEFLRGDFRKQNAREILDNIHRSPQEVNEDYCFCGCRGDSVNVGLHRLVLISNRP